MGMREIGRLLAILICFYGVQLEPQEFVPGGTSLGQSFLVGVNYAPNFGSNYKNKFPAGVLQNFDSGVPAYGSSYVPNYPGSQIKRNLPQHGIPNFNGAVSQGPGPIYATGYAPVYGANYFNYLPENVPINGITNVPFAFNNVPVGVDVSTAGNLGIFSNFDNLGNLQNPPNLANPSNLVNPPNFPNTPNLPNLPNIPNLPIDVPSNANNVYNGNNGNNIPSNVPGPNYSLKDVKNENYAQTYERRNGGRSRLESRTNFGGNRRVPFEETRRDFDLNGRSGQNFGDRVENYGENGRNVGANVENVRNYDENARNFAEHARNFGGTANYDETGNEGSYAQTSFVGNEANFNRENERGVTQDGSDPVETGNKHLIFPAIRQDRQDSLSFGSCIVVLNRDCPHPDIKYYVYSRKHPDIPEAVRIGADELVSNITETSFNKSLPTKIIVHGYNSDMYLNALVEIKNQYMINGDYNIFAIDWSPLAQGPCYPAAVWNARFAGRCSSLLVQRLRELDVTDIHVIGFSLGAHVAAFMANHLVPYKVPRITGLDPALPGFTTIDNLAKLDASDAEFVDVLHTNVFIQGKVEQCGHVDFYLNGGIIQPGCWADERFFACNHHRAPFYFAESINTPVGFYGWPCFNYASYIFGRCPPQEPQSLMGEFIDRAARGMHLVITDSVSPFAVGRFEGPTIEIFLRVYEQNRLSDFDRYKQEVEDDCGDEYQDKVMPPEMPPNGALPPDFINGAFDGGLIL